MGISMDSTAFHELIAQVRGTAAELAEAEQKVAAFKAELAQQEHGAQLDCARQKAIRPIPKRNSGWLPGTRNGRVMASLFDDPIEPQRARRRAA
jgi:hypothetical protein